VRSDSTLGLNDKDLSMGRFGGGEGNTNSLSGLERNRLFLWDGGSGNFLDASALSGLDHLADGRPLALLDLEGDGWLDVAIASANDPLLLLWRNEMGALLPERKAVAVRLVGSNVGPDPRPGRSPRDGTGARVELHVGGRVLVRESHAGEGFAAQNSSTLVIGVGDAERIERVVVRWPGGATSERADVATGVVLEAWEDPAQSPEGDAVRVVGPLAPWRELPGALSPGGAPQAVDVTAGFPRALHDLAAEGVGAPKLRIYITFATWCAACHAELPVVRRLREAFDEADLDLVGVPMDGTETGDEVLAFERDREPSYRVLQAIDDELRRALQAHLDAELVTEALPCAVLTDGAGRVLSTSRAPPSVSELRAWLDLVDG
jgi:thiol-disulfide isomerase/thioredoxin